MSSSWTAARLGTMLPFGVAIDGLDAGRVVRLTAGNGRMAIARTVRDEFPSELPVGAVGLDAELQDQLRVLPGDPLAVQPVDLRAASQVQVVPAFSAKIDKSMQDAVRNTLVDGCAPVWPGCRFQVSVGEGTGSGTFEVVEVISDQGPVDGAVVTDETSIHVRIPTPIQLAKLIDDVSLDDVAGLDSVVDRLRDLVETPLLRPQLYRQLGISPPRGVLLYGPPGVGKTFVARALANALAVHLEYVNAPEIVGSSYGKTEANLRELFGTASRNTPALILIDEIDALVPARRRLSTQTDYRMVAQMLAALDGLKRLDGVMVLGTTNRPEAIDPALRRPGRFDAELFLAPPDTADRLEILRLYFGRMPVTESLRQYLRDLADHTHGFVPADLAALARQAGLQALRRAGGVSVTSGREVVVDVVDVFEARKEVEPSLLRGAAIRRPDRGFEDVVGYDDVVRRLRGIAAELATRGSARLLFLGPSGVGKSLMITAFASEIEAHLLDLTPADVFTSWLGETEEAVRDAFHLAARVSPAVLAFDNLESVTPTRDLEVGISARRVVDQFLAEMDSMPDGVVIAGATSHEDLLDPAVRRRFDEVIVLDPPDDAVRRAFVRSIYPLLEREQLDRVVEESAGKTLGALLPDLSGPLAAARRAQTRKHANKSRSSATER